MPVRKIVKTIDAAFRDAGRARLAHSDPKFRRDVQTDRRGTLRRFETVQHALRDREKIEAAKAATNGKNGKNGKSGKTAKPAKAKKT